MPLDRDRRAAGDVHASGHDPGLRVIDAIRTGPAERADPAKAPGMQGDMKSSMARRRASGRSAPTSGSGAPTHGSSPRP